MTIQVRIKTNGTVKESHYGLLDFGYLTITNLADESEVKLDAERYEIESEAVLVSFDPKNKWDANDKPSSASVDWHNIKANLSLYKIELFCGFADDIETIDLPTVKYSLPVLEFEGGIIPITLDNDTDYLFKYRMFDVSTTGYSILMQDGGIACVELHEDDNYVYAELYQSRLDLTDLKQTNKIFDTLGEGKMYRADYPNITDVNDKSVLAETLSWLAVGATFQHDPTLHETFVQAVLS